MPLSPQARLGLTYAKRLAIIGQMSFTQDGGRGGQREIALKITNDL
jgi:hypothetical protein